MASGTRPLNPLATPFKSSPNRFTELQADFTNLSQGDGPAICKLTNLNLFFLDKLTHLENLISQRLLTDFRKRLDNLERETGFLKRENADLKQKLAQVEDSTKILYLRLEGLAEDDQTDLLTMVANTLSKTGIHCTIADLDSVHRIGKQNHATPRPIIIRFVKQSKRDAILYNRMNLNKSLENTGPLWLNDEVSDITKRNRKTVRDVADHAKSLGIEDIKIHGDGLLIGTTKIKHQDLDLLPPLFTVACAKTIHTDQHIFFQSEASPFSNFFPTRFEDSNAMIFECIEQAFQYRKALFHDSNQIAAKILATRDPFEHKRLGNLITPIQQWRDTEANSMSELLMYKFTQNNSLADLLLSTNNKRLHEATGDTKWAIGSSLTAKATKDGSWTGGDLLGQLLEGVRDVLTGQSPNTTSPTSTLNVPPPTTSPHDDLAPLPPDDDSHSCTSESREVLDLRTSSPPTTNSQPPPPLNVPANRSPIHTLSRSFSLPSTPLSRNSLPNTTFPQYQSHTLPPPPLMSPQAIKQSLSDHPCQQPITQQPFSPRSMFTASQPTLAGNNSNPLRNAAAASRRSSRNSNNTGRSYRY